MEDSNSVGKQATEAQLLLLAAPILVTSTSTSPIYLLPLRPGWMPLTSTFNPFSRSSGLSFGVGGTSSGLARPPFREREDEGDDASLTDLGNSDRRGVSAVTALRADRRIVSRTFHSRFFATKNRIVIPTGTRVSFECYLF